MKTKTCVAILGCAVVAAAAIVLLSAKADGTYVPERVRAMQEKARTGDAEALLQLGNFHYNGDGVPRDVTEALRWWRAAAEKGSVVAQLNLGTVLVQDASPERVAEGVTWVTRAAEAGDEGAQRNLGLMYLQGRGVAKHLQRAAIWLHRAAAKGDPASQYNLAVMFENGEGTARDLAESRRWYERAAQNGHPLARQWLERQERR